MQILVLNGGSSSIKFSIFNADESSPSAEPALILDGEVSEVGSSRATLSLQAPKEADKTEAEVSAGSTEQALSIIFGAISTRSKIDIQAVGYRVVHPGAKLHDHQRITESILRDIEEASAFAPLHNPEAVAMIRSGMRHFPYVAHYACFDTVFHQTMPVEATTYALPSEWRALGVRRYGFHGLSCEWIVRQMKDAQGHVPKRMIIAHLGSGCSITAVADGHSIDTTMGFTPTGGLVMGTRPGDLDPSILLYLLRQQNQDPKSAASAIESALNHKSGMVALSGLPNDMRAIRKAASEGDMNALLAIKVFVRSVTKAIGSYSWLLGGVDVIIFTGGIGEHDADTRAEAMGNLSELGITIDRVKNRSVTKGKYEISEEDSSTKIFVVPVQEDCMIAMHVVRMHQSSN
jgi:acetate kinase